MSNRLLVTALMAAAFNGWTYTTIASTAPELLDAQQILSQVIGHTIVFQDDDKDRVEEYLAEDGVAHGRSRTQGPFEMEWQIRFGHYLCLVSNDPQQSGCVRVSLQPPSKITFHLDVGETEGPFIILPNNPSKL